MSCLLSTLTPTCFITAHSEALLGRAPTVPGAKDTGAGLQEHSSWVESIPRSPLSDPFLNQNLSMSLPCKNSSTAPHSDLAQAIPHPLPSKQDLWALPKATLCHRFPSSNRVYHAEHFAHRLLFQLPHRKQGRAGL